MTRIAEESAVDMARLAGLSTVVLRLAAIYGPGRGVRERLKAGSYKLIDDGAHFFSRVHVDDIVGIIRAAAAARAGGRRLLRRRRLADDPARVRRLAGGAPRRARRRRRCRRWRRARRAARVRNRKVSNARLRRELDYRFRHPSYVEGEQAIEAEEREAAAPPPRPVLVEPPRPPEPPPPIAPPPPMAPPPPSEPPRSTDPLRQLADRLAEAIALLDDGDAATARATLESARELLPGIEERSKTKKS